MKKYFALIASAMLIMACDKPVEEEKVTELSVSPASVTVAAEETSAGFAVNCNEDWTVTCSDAWIKTYTKTGTGNGQVAVTFDANTDVSSPRYADFVVKAGTKTVKFKLTQNKAAEDLFLECSEPSVTVDANELTATFSIHSNVGWAVSTDADWINEFTAKGHDDGTVEVAFDTYLNTEVERTATLTVSGNSVEPLVLTLTQRKAVPGETAFTMTMKEFNDAPEDLVNLYRLSGIVDKMISSTYGSIIIKDITGSALVYCLKTAKDGRDADFRSLNVNIGDYIVVVGKRGSYGKDAELVDGYHESHVSINNVTIGEYLEKPDGSNRWYRLTGTVSGITDETNGVLTLTDGSGSVKISGVTTGIGGEKGKFSTLGVQEGATLTVIAPVKNGSTASNVYYESHKGASMAKGILAKWEFNADGVAAGIDKTWTGGTVNATDKIDASFNNAAAGDGGKYIDAGTGSGRMTFVQCDKSSSSVASKARWIMYYTGQPGIDCVAVDDYFLFTVNPGETVPEGTKIKFSCVLRPAGTSIGYWALEYLDGDTWVMASTLPVQTITTGGKNYSYNIARETNDQSDIEGTFVTTKEVGTVQIRMRAAAPISPSGTTFSDGISTGGMRFRGEGSNKMMSPTIEVI